MTDREAVFSAIRAALEPLPERAAYPEWDAQVTAARFAHGEQDTVALFAERLQAAHGFCLAGWEALAQFLREQGLEGAEGYLDPALAEQAGGHLGGFTLAGAIDRARIDDYRFGITPASGAIAETGSIILRDGDTPHRLAALAPWVHIAVVRRETVVRTVAEAVAALGDDPSIVLATGPSKTADIEGILIEGVHGPGVQACCVV